MDEEQRQEGQPEGAEGKEASKLSKKVAEEASGDSEAPLGASDQHSDAPGPQSTG